MSLINARVQTAAQAYSNKKLLVLSKDEADICTIGTDFIFDALNPACYVAGSPPASGAVLPAGSGIFSVYITSGGSGGTTGTFPLTFSGGVGAGAAGTFTVAGGAVTAINITAAGSGYTSSPTAIFSACPGLTGVTYQVQLGNLLNLARDVQPAQGRAGAVTAVLGGGTGPIFDGKGLAFVNGVTTPLQMRKTGANNTRACDPTLEVFVDFIEIVWASFSSIITSTSPYAGAGGNSGFTIASGSMFARETTTQFFNPISLNTLYQFTKLVRFNVAANTSTIKTWIGSGGVVMAGSTLTGKPPASYVPAGASSATTIGGRDVSTSLTMSGSVYRIIRDYVGVTGMTDDDVLALIQRDYAYGAARFA